MSADVTSEEFRVLVGQFRASLKAMEQRGIVSVSAETSELPRLQVDAPAPAPATVPPAAVPPAASPTPTSDAEEPVAAALPPSEPSAVAAAPASIPAPPSALPSVQGGAVQSLADLRADIGDCQRCELAQSRKTLVFGTGSEAASLMFVGEAPGAEEDRLGEPFVGPSGQLLDKMIVAMGWSRETVYIANVLKCRPPQNRDPKAVEVAACEGFLARQIQRISPSVIVTLGKPAAHLLLKSTASMGALRGVWQSYEGVAVMPTYHPAYLLRDPSKKRETWADLQQVMARLASLGIASP
jgi:DNA polymerase